MNLKEMKERLDAAAEALKSNAEDATLKAAFEKAQTEYNTALKAEEDSKKKTDNTDDGELDVSKLDPKAQKLIADLRKENADRRKANKTLDEKQAKLKKALVEAGVIEDDEESPEEKIQNLSQQASNAAVENAVLAAALEHGVSKEDVKFFKFLVHEKLGALKDDEELDEAGFAELAKQAKRTKTVTTSVTTGGDGKTPPAGGGEEVTLDAFVSMTIGEKSGLYQKNPDLYNKLKNEAVAKRRL